MLIAGFIVGYLAFVCCVGDWCDRQLHRARNESLAEVVRGFLSWAVWRIHSTLQPHGRILRRALYSILGRQPDGRNVRHVLLQFISRVQFGGDCVRLFFLAGYMACANEIAV